MSYDLQDDIQINQLNNQFGASKQKVMGLINGALTMSSDGEISKRLDSMGFSQDVRPDWFGSRYIPRLTSGAPSEIPSDISEIPQD